MIGSRSGLAATIVLGTAQTTESAQTVAVARLYSQWMLPGWHRIEGCSDRAYDGSSGGH